MNLHLSRALLAATLLALTVSACDQTALTEDPGSGTFDRTVENGAVIPGKYIVVLKPEVVAGKNIAQFVGEVADDYQAETYHEYGKALAGFAAPLGDGVVARLRTDPRVAYVEPDRYIQLPPFTVEGLCDVNPDHPKCSPPGDGGGDPPPPPSDQDVPWGIAAVNGGGYAGSNVAWSLDTGVDLDHPDLNVDVGRCANFVNSGRDAKLGCNDGNGHGTHTSGTIAAIDNGFGVVGVAAGATIVPVKVLSAQGSGSYSGVIAGVNYVAAKGSSGDVANMSLGGPISQAVDDAVVAAASLGIRFTLAAGNESDNANNHSPARANGPNVYTVSAFGQGGGWASFSNYGNPPVDFAEPGVSVLSTYKDGGYATGSGTSMAAPHLAGILLLGTVRNGGSVSGDPDGNADVIGVH